MHEQHHINPGAGCHYHGIEAMCQVEWSKSDHDQSDYSHADTRVVRRDYCESSRALLPVAVVQ